MGAYSSLIPNDFELKLDHLCFIGYRIVSNVARQKNSKKNCRKIVLISYLTETLLLMTMKTLLRLYKITTHLEEVRLIRYRIAVCYSSYENYQHSKLTKLVMRIATFYSFEPKFSCHCKFRQFMITKTCLKETISTTRNAFLGIQSHSYKQLWVFQRRSWNSILFIIYYSYYREQRLR